jgi:hypothetical protein
MHPAGVFSGSNSKVGVTGAEHGGEASHFHFAALLFAGLFEMPVVTDFLECAFAVDLFFEAPEGLLDGFTFLEPDFSQLRITSSLVAVGFSRLPVSASSSISQVRKGRDGVTGCQLAKMGGWATPQSGGCGGSGHGANGGCQVG